MKRIWQYSLVVLLGVASYSTAGAQTPVVLAPCETSVGPGYIDGGYSFRSHASTEAEGILSGQGRLLQGAGEYNRNTAAALLLREQARALYQDNYRNGLKAYFDLKRINASYRAEMAPPPLSKEKLDEWNRQELPMRLTKREYNSDSGRVQWPAVLQISLFDAHRYELEALFARRTASEFGVTSDFYRMVQQDATAMKETLKAYLRNQEKFFTDQEYIAAQNFLNSLTHEARLAPDLDGLVAN